MSERVFVVFMWRDTQKWFEGVYQDKEDAIAEAESLVDHMHFDDEWEREERGVYSQYYWSGDLYYGSWVESKPLQ